MSMLKFCFNVYVEVLLKCLYRGFVSVSMLRFCFNIYVEVLCQCLC